LLSLQHFLFLNSHFSDNNIAIGLVAGILAKIIFIITIIGTDNNIHTIHHNDHQNDKDIIIARGLKFNLLPINLGSIIFHINICTHIKPDVIIMKG
jgi:hypothetical protein